MSIYILNPGPGGDSTCNSRAKSRRVGAFISRCHNRPTADSLGIDRRCNALYVRYTLHLISAKPIRADFATGGR
jgi:hypothetical protein